MATSHLGKIILGSATAVGAMLLFVSPSFGQTATPLSGQYKRFLEQDAIYLITDQEEEVYRMLKTDEERDRFIASFWTVRDPTPGTTRNEFRDQFVERTPDLNSARLQLGVLALGLGQPERALNGIVPGLMSTPFHYDMLALAGYASEKLGRLDDAVKYYERARDAEQADEKLLQALASLYDKLGQTQKATAVRKEISG